MLNRIFPFLEWFKGYSKESLRIDAISGLTVALVLIPQSMAYAQLAGLPPYYGLYASFLPPMIASLFGSSRQLATGPVAVVSLMTSASLAPLVTPGSHSFIAYAVTMAFAIGVFQLALGVFRLGLVVNFLSHPVVNGFTNAAALIIASSQFSKLFGVDVENAPHHYETIINVCKAAFHFTHWPTFFMGLFAFGLMYGLRRIAPKVPNVLVAVVLAILISRLMGFERNVKIDISQIRDPHAAEIIREFNISAKEILTLGEERTKASNLLPEVRKGGDPLAVLDAEHTLAGINAKIELSKQKAQFYRNELRGLFYVIEEQPDGKPIYLLRSSQNKGSGRTWRMKVGNSPLKPDQILMIGGGEVVGVIPKGLPAFSVPNLDPGVLLQLLPYAAIISLLGFMEAISIAKAMAAKTGQRLDPNQELIGQGLANMLGAIGKSYPTSGSFSRSAVNLQAGAVSGLSSVFTSMTVVLALMFFTPLLYHLPQAVLAAVIMMAVIGLVNVSGFIHAWRAKWYDGAISIITFICTLVFAPHLDKGIMVGVILSLIVFLYKSMRPTVVSLSRHDDKALRSSFAHKLAECRYIDLVRFDGPLFFANSSYLEDQINERIMTKKDLRHIIIAANGISDMDASGEECLSLLIDRVRSSGVKISLSGVNELVMEVLRRTHLLEKIGLDNIFPTMERAIASVHEDAHRGGEEKECPLTTVCRVTYYSDN